MDYAANPQPLTEKDKRLQRLYGRVPTRGNLLNHQLEGRKWFDSGDFALSQAHRASNIGSVNTGSDHPTRKSISQPSAPVPSSGNVDDGASQQLHNERDIPKLGVASQLQHETARDTQKEPTDTEQRSHVSSSAIQHS